MLIMKLKYSLICLLALCALSCARRPAVPETRTFPKVNIPSMYADPSQRAEYVTQHYWDAFLSTSNTYHTDSTIINGVEQPEVETSLATWLTLLGTQELPDAQRAVANLFSRLEAYEAADTSSHIVTRMSEIVSNYLYDPNSPYRDEDLYLPFVSGLAQSKYIPESLHPSYAYDARMCALNQRGQKAPDFSFTDIKGRAHRLYDVSADYTLLFFSNPGCEACKEIIDELSSWPLAGYLIEEGALAVVNVYIDEQVDDWKAYQSYYPDTWYNGYDAEMLIRQDLLYCVRAIPSLYLLDADKRVMLKDATPEKVFEYLGGIE